MSVKTAAESLEAAIKTLSDVRVIRDPAATVAPPAAWVGPPRLTWEGYCVGEPTSATFVVVVMAAMNERAMEALWDLVTRVSEVVDEVGDAVVRSATPGVFNAGGSDLPSYELTVDVSL